MSNVRVMIPNCRAVGVANLWSTPCIAVIKSDTDRRAWIELKRNLHVVLGDVGRIVIQTIDGKDHPIFEKLIVIKNA